MRLPGGEHGPPSAGELERLARRGRSEEIAKRLAGLDERQRREIGRRLVPRTGEILREWSSSFSAKLGNTLEGLSPALLGTATLSELRKVGWATLPNGFGFAGGDPRALDAAHAVLADCRPEWLGAWADWALEQRPDFFSVVRMLVRDGILKRPSSEAYITAFITDRFFDPADGEPPRDREILADPALLEHEVWRLFEVEGEGPGCLSGADKFSHPAVAWSGTLRRLAASGHLSRKRLLDASLAALSRDFSSAHAGWHSRFHEALEPALDERAARVESYARLLANPIPNTVAFALASLAILDKAGRLDPSPRLVQRLGPALASERKTTVRRALSLLAGAVRRDPLLREATALAACEALGHEDADVQRRALDAIEAAAAQPAVQGRLLGYADAIAPTLRERLAGLVGLAIDAPAEDGAPALAELEGRAAGLPDRARALARVDEALTAARRGEPVPALALSLADVPVLAAAEPVRPIASLDELVDEAAAIVENPEPPPLQVERVLDGVARLHTARPDGFERRTSSLRKRAERASLDGIRNLIAAWLSGERPRGDDPHFDDPVDRRATELAERVARGTALGLLAAPTHEGGWIDPIELVRRIAGYEAHGRPPGDDDLVQALMRLAPDGRREALGAAAALASEPGRALRTALGEEPETLADRMLERAAMLARGAGATGPRFTAVVSMQLSHPTPAAVADPPPSEAERRAIPALRIGTGLPWILAGRSDLGWMGGEGLVYVWPAGHASLWAQAIAELGSGVEYDPGRADGRLLEPALDPDRPLGEIGGFAVALGLTQIGAAPRTLAIDVAIAAIADGRLDATLLGDPCRELLKAGVLVPARAGPALRTIAAQSPLHAEVVRLTLEACIGLPAPLRGLHALLDPLNELCADAPARPSRTRALARYSAR